MRNWPACGPAVIQQCLKRQAEERPYHKRDAKMDLPETAPVAA